MTTAVERREQKSLPELVNASKDELRRLLPDYDRFARILTTEVRRTPKLAECTPESFLASAFVCAQLDLEPGPLGDAWLIPRWNGKRRVDECTFMIGYRGIEKLALRSGHILSIETRTVYEGDDFEVEYFPEATVKHIPAFQSGAEPKLWYAVARRADGSLLIHVLDKDHVEARRKCSATPDRGPWKDHYDAMARKSVIRAMWQNLPLEVRDPAVDRAIETDDQTLDTSALRPLPDARNVDQSTGEIIDVEPEDDNQDTQEGDRAQTRQDTEEDATSSGDGPGGHDVGRASGEPGPRPQEPPVPEGEEPAPQPAPSDAPACAHDGPLDRVGLARTRCRRCGATFGAHGPHGVGTTDDDPEPRDDQATDAQIKAIHTLAGKVGLIAGDDDQAYRAELDVRYEATSSKDLSRDQAADFIDWLQASLNDGGEK